MKAYVELIQRKEREIGCDVLTHQKVSFPVLSFPQLADEHSGLVQTMPTL